MTPSAECDKFNGEKTLGGKSETGFAIHTFCHNTLVPHIDDRQKTYHDNSQALQYNCNVWLKIHSSQKHTFKAGV